MANNNDDTIENTCETLFDPETSRSQCDKPLNEQNPGKSHTSCSTCQEASVINNFKAVDHNENHEVNSSSSELPENEQTNVTYNGEGHNPIAVETFINDEHESATNIQYNQEEQQDQAFLITRLNDFALTLRIVLSRNKQQSIEVNQLKKQFELQMTEQSRKDEQLKNDVDEVKKWLLIPFGLCLFAFTCLFYSTASIKQIQALDKNFLEQYANNEKFQKEINLLQYNLLELNEKLRKFEELSFITKQLENTIVQHETYINESEANDRNQHDQMLETNQLQNELESNVKSSQNHKTNIHAQLKFPYIDNNSKWAPNGIVVAGGNGKGSGLNQISFPQGIYIDDDDTVYVADTSNHRIVEWKSAAINGQIVTGDFEEKNPEQQLKRPIKMIIDQQNDCLIVCDYENKRVVGWSRRNTTNREIIVSNIGCWDLTMDKDGYLYVSDVDKHEVKRWTLGQNNGKTVAGGNGKGNGLDQLNYPYYIFVDEDRSVYVSDTYNHRVVKWRENAKEGIVVAGGRGEGKSLAQLSYPRGIVVDQQGNMYVAEGGNHRVMRWLNGEKEGYVIIGGNGFGKQSHQLHDPNDVSFDHKYNLYVVESSNHRVQKFNINRN